MNSNKTYRKLRLFKNIVLMGMLPLGLKGEETVQKKKKKRYFGPPNYYGKEIS